MRLRDPDLSLVELLNMILGAGLSFVAFGKMACLWGDKQTFAPSAAPESLGSFLSFSAPQGVPNLIVSVTGDNDRLSRSLS